MHGNYGKEYKIDRDLTNTHLLVRGLVKNQLVNFGKEPTYRICSFLTKDLMASELELEALTAISVSSAAMVLDA